MKFYNNKLRNMKISKLLTIAFLSCSLVSCNDWLDVEPNTEMDRNDLFKNEAGFADAMSGVYAIMSNNNLYGKTLTWHLVELMGGGAYANAGYNLNHLRFCFHPNAENYYVNNQNQFIDPIWRNAYNAIANINSILESIDEHQNVFEGDDYNVFKGEALGLRAFLHFDLLRLYGDAYTSNDYSATNTYIPYVSDLSSNVYPLLTVDLACKAMLQDLEKAKELLKSDPMYTGAAPSAYVCDEAPGFITNRTKYNIKDWHNRRFHFNYYAAIGTMARIYLWMGNKAKALECAKEVIDAQQSTFPWVNTELIANVNSSSTTVARDRTFCTEHIFAMNILDMDDRMDGILYEGQTAFTSSNTMGMNADYCFDAATRDSDPRYAYLKLIYASDYIIPTKYYKDVDEGNNYFPWAANRVPLMRLSEMYYIAAECEPNLATAIEYLEEVRRHRGLSPYPLTCTDAVELQLEIEKEYRKEFISEGQLFYYKKRMNQEIQNKTKNKTYTITPDCYTMPRPDDEDTYGGRNND